MGGSDATAETRALAWRTLCQVLAFGEASEAEIDSRVRAIMARTSVDPNTLAYGKAVAIYLTEFGPTWALSKLGDANDK